MAKGMGECDGSKPYIVISMDRLTVQAFFMGLIQGAYCLSPTGMLASMSEEVKKPEQTIPRAM
jgi:amino acid transporter